jgi:hypothetical protein
MQKLSEKRFCVFCLNEIKTDKDLCEYEWQGQKYLLHAADCWSLFSIYVGKLEWKMKHYEYKLPYPESFKLTDIVSFIRYDQAQPLIQRN